MAKKNKRRSSPFALPGILFAVVLVLAAVRLSLPLLLGPEEPAGTPAPSPSAAATPTPTAPVEVVTPAEETQTPTARETASATPAPSAPATVTAAPAPTPTAVSQPSGSIVVPANVSRELFGDCGKNADGSLSPSWYPGRTDRDPDTGKVTYRWDRWQSTLDTLAKYGAIYRKNADQNAVYLTFDCGYEQGYTEKILDTLKEKGVKAIFFCAGDFFDDDRAPGLIRRMVDEGHLIGNHTLHHPAMVYKSDADFADELAGIQKRVNEVLGYDYPLAFYRPPEGATNERDLYLARELGYTTVLWSFAYYDYDPKDQWSVSKALDNAEARLHPGCVYLLHAVSSTNTEMLGDLIDYIRAAGYELRRIDQ